MRKERIPIKDAQFVTDNILISIFSSAQALKGKIRERIRMRQKCGWIWGGMTSHGPYIILCFTKTVEVRPGCGSSVYSEYLHSK